MKKLSFSEINSFVVKHTDAKAFSKDLELFKKHFPSHKLNNDLARANQFTFDILDGQMLVALLDIVSTDDILKNRASEYPTQKVQEVHVVPKTMDEVKAIIVANTKITGSFLEKKGTNGLEQLCSCTEDEIVDFINSILEKRKNEITSLLKTTYGYTDDMINVMPEEYLFKLVLEADDNEQVLEFERLRIEESKPESMEALLAFLAAEFGLSDEDLNTIPEETLKFFLQRSKSEIIIIGCKLLLDKKSEVEAIDKNNIAQEVENLEIKKDDLTSDVEELEATKEILEDTIEKLENTNKETSTPPKKKGKSKKNSPK